MVPMKLSSRRRLGDAEENRDEVMGKQTYTTCHGQLVFKFRVIHSHFIVGMVHPFSQVLYEPLLLLCVVQAFYFIMELSLVKS